MVLDVKRATAFALGGAAIVLAIAREINKGKATYETS